LFAPSRHRLCLVDQSQRAICRGIHIKLRAIAGGWNKGRKCSNNSEKTKVMSHGLAWQEVSSDKLCQRDGDGFRQKKSFGVRQ